MIGPAERGPPEAAEGKSKEEVKSLVLNYLAPEKRRSISTVAVKRVVVESEPPLLAQTKEDSPPIKTEVPVYD